MKKTTIVIGFLMILISILAVSCGSAVTLESNPDLSVDVPVVESSCTACGPETTTESAPTIEPTLDLSVGKKLVEGKCITCHGIEITTNARYSREAWTKSVDHMVGYGMSLTDQQRTDLIDYLAATYTNE